MRAMRAATSKLTAGMLVMLAACTGASNEVPPAPGSGTGSSSSALITRFGNGRPLPAGCPAGDNARAQSVAFVAGGNAWVLDPESSDASCLFPTPAPGPFAWNPRGDRMLLDGLSIRSIEGKHLRDATSPTSPLSSWGHPIGKAVVYIPPSGTSLLKVYTGTQRTDDITPVPDVRYLNVIYHPSGLALAFVVDTGDGQEIWLSSNVGEDPMRLVFAVGETTFGALAFTADGRTLLYAAVHGDDAPLLHALDLTDPTINQGGRYTWPFRRRFHAQVIRNLERAGAKVIAYDVQFTEPSNPSDDQALADAIARAGNVVLATTVVDDRGRTNVFGGDEVLRELGARAAHSGLTTDSGRVVRRMPREVDGLEAFSVAAVAGETRSRAALQRSSPR